jgi:two-component system, NtrC family, response regulator GlrR
MFLSKGRKELNRILGGSNEVKRLRREIEKISSCDVTVLITGDSGTGKELTARGIHYMSARAEEPFIAVNCGAIPVNLVENELFGHHKGAFTDASLPQEGVVAEAEGGTLFLDEVGALNPYIQVKLLRLLQEKEFKRLGDPKTRKANVRIIAATNTNLKALVEESAFREDLYFRLNIVSLLTPPLRDRIEDVPMLVDFFLKKYSDEYGVPLKKFSPEAMDSLISYCWPGNIRELENRIQHLIVMVPDPIITCDLLELPNATQLVTEVIKQNSDSFDCFKVAKQKVIENFEKDYLTRLLTKFNGNLVGAAQKAGKSRTAFWNLLSKYRLSPRQFRQ